MLAPSIGAMLTAFALALAPVPAPAATPITFWAQLRPKRLGASTAVSIGFKIGADGGPQPPALSSFDVVLPRGMGFGETRLGLATCSAGVLLASGPATCPHESVMGFGSAHVKVAFGSELVNESAHATIFMSQSVENDTTMLLYFDGRRPVIAPILLRLQVLTPKGRSVSELSTTISPIATAPGGPDVSITALHVSIGPPDLLYRERVHGRAVLYRPLGLTVPEACPRRGFEFAASFAFQDGERVARTHYVGCPETPRHVHARSRRRIVRR